MLTCNKIVEKSNKPKEGREAWTMSAIVIDVHGFFTSTAFDLRSWSVGKLPKKNNKTKQKPNVRHGWWKQSLVWLHVCPPTLAFSNVGKRPRGRVKQFLWAAGGETEVRVIKRDLGQGHTSAAKSRCSARRRREDILWRSHGQMIW